MRFILVDLFRITGWTCLNFFPFIMVVIVVDLVLSCNFEFFKIYIYCNFVFLIKNFHDFDNNKKNLLKRFNLFKNFLKLQILNLKFKINIQSIHTSFKMNNNQEEEKV